MSYTTIKTCASSNMPTNASVGDIFFDTETKSLLIKEETGWRVAQYDLTHNIAENSLSVQWFEKEQDGDLVLRTASIDSRGPAIELWEAVNSTDYSPRESDYETEEVGIQYFEDINGDISPRNNPI